MSARKTERLMNLIFALLVTRQYLTKAQIRAAIPDYADATTDDAFNRMFERDKEELRELGIRVDVGSHDPLFDDEQGYRISRDVVELPDLQLTREEAAVVGLATQVWENAGLARGSSQALVKLKTAGVEVDTSQVRMAEPRLSTDEPAFDAIWDAATRRVPISFTYARPGQTESERRLEPWGILSWHDRWYVGGFDRDREAPRLFRVSRILGEVAVIGKAGSYEVPEGVDMRRVARELFPTGQDQTGVVRVRSGRGQSLRRDAVTSTRVDDDHDDLEVSYQSAARLAADIASYGPDAVAISPPELRDAVVARLRLAADGRLDALS